MMLRIVKVSLFVVCAGLFVMSGLIQAKSKTFVPGEVLVSFHPGTMGVAQQQLHQKIGGKVVKNLKG